MTSTDDTFAAAARARAEQYRGPRMHAGTVTDREVQAHQNGWHAARDHLAAQEPSDAEVEAAAELLANATHRKPDSYKNDWHS